MNAVYDSIIENLRHIKIVTEPTPDSFKKDTIQTGNGREYTIKDFVTKYFPTTYQAKKGPIHSKDGSSQEIDCVLLAPNHPQLITPVREVIIAEGVHAAIELKPDISTLTDNSEFARALKQIQSINRIKRNITTKAFGTIEFPVVSEYAKKIPTYLFAFKSRPALDIINFLMKKVDKKEYFITDIPDFIVTLDNGIIFFTPYPYECMFSNIFKNIDKPHPSGAFIHFNSTDEATLAFFLLTLYLVRPPELTIADNILKQYIELDKMNLKYTTYPVEPNPNYIEPTTIDGDKK